MSVNSVVIGGNLTRDVEIKTVGETKLGLFTLALNEKYKDKEEVHYFEFTAWGKTAELLEKYTGKGDELIVEAVARQEKWKDKEGGNRSKITFKVEKFHFGRKANANGSKKVENEAVKDDDEQAPSEPSSDEDVPF